MSFVFDCLLICVWDVFLLVSALVLCSSDLKDLFSKFGDVVRADVAMDRISGKSKGFGTALILAVLPSSFFSLLCKETFISAAMVLQFFTPLLSLPSFVVSCVVLGTIAFAKKADAEAAMNALNETEFRGRNIQVRPDQFVPKTAQQ